eukprot:TRINITY_DN3670_c0_g1_i2.p1 TRINITY_DN3670_c0_g1~~TRINITY_DN3670_c0_g1_i2.p1  ORF type:complete len:362 (-),score=92.51 TRINITY_DN3670_c0_g1_i2:29-1114(-)
MCIRDRYMGNNIKKKKMSYSRVSLVGFLLAFLISAVSCNQELYDSPVIGILAAPVHAPLDKIKPMEYSYFAASYVKYAESAGLRVVPINWDLPRDEMEKLLYKLNGVIFPGGDNILVEERTGLNTPFGEAFSWIVRVAVKMNKEGRTFPIFAICQGFQWLISYSARDIKLLNKFEGARGVSLPLVLEQEPKFDFFRNLTDEHLDFLENEKSMPYANFLGISLEDFNKKLARFWRLLATTKSANGSRFVSAVEHKSLPFFAVQFHPERSIFEFFPERQITHNKNTIQIAHHWIMSFREFAAKSPNRFPSQEELQKMLIYNYSPRVTRGIAYFEQAYFFNPIKVRRNINDRVKHLLKDKKSTS